ncbi:MAG: GumC family protein [Leptolyngbyaceae cyanobacterium SL_7_1]|nr:GumC family protein [Leptolyngbyaceae cyanobacterium SL_7_1]
MQLLVEPNYEQRPDALREGLPESLLPGAATVEVDYATEIRLMQSPTLVSRAVETLRSDYPDISVDEIRSRLSISRVLETEDEVETKILQVEYTSNNPEKTQRVLEALKEVYLSYSQEQQKVRLNNGLAFIDEQLPEVRGEVAQAERSLEQFREGQSVIDPQAQAEEVTRALNAIAEERRTIRAQFEDAQMRFNNTQRQLARSPESALLASRLSQSERFQTLLNTLQQTEFALAQQRVTYTDNAPTVRALVRELNNQRALLQQEASQILGEAAGQFNLSESSLLAESQLSEVDLNLTNQLVETQTNLVGLNARDQSLAQAESRLRAELNRFPELIAEYNRLQPDIDIKRDTLQQLLRARQELSIDIARGGYNWQVVDSADLGEKTGPNLGNDLLLGAVLGLFLGSLVVFLVESMDNVVHSSDKLKETVALPLIGTVPRLPRSITGSRFALGNRTRGIPMLQAANWPCLENRWT